LWLVAQVVLILMAVEVAQVATVLAHYLPKEQLQLRLVRVAHKLLLAVIMLGAKVLTLCSLQLPLREVDMVDGQVRVVA
tara:strand:- start:225 stop:461 length:237 start_codon:yes stop_codon:yes gene_type:complete